MADEPVVTLNEAQAATIRKALHIGLTCYGEIEQRRNAMTLYEATREKLPADLRILHPTGTSVRRIDEYRVPRMVDHDELRLGQRSRHGFLRVEQRAFAGRDHEGRLVEFLQRGAAVGRQHVGDEH